VLAKLISELRAVKPFVWGVVAVLALTAAFLYKHQDWRVSQKLYENGAHAEAVVTGKDFDTERFEYAFRVGERSYRGSGTGGYGNPSFAELHVDDPVVVFYLPADPAVSEPGDPKLRVEDQHRWLAWSLILFVPLAAALLAGELKRHG
jgi:hypothetical protein